MKEEISLCKFCNNKTKTIKIKSLSASENIHYRYECGKCHAKKELKIIDIIRKVGKMKTYKVWQHYDSGVSVKVKAKTEEEAREKAEKMIDEMPEKEFMMIIKANLETGDLDITNTGDEK